MTRKSRSKPAFTVIRGGKLLDIAKRKAVPVDILIKGDTIAAIEALPDRDLRPLVVDVVAFLLDAQRIGMRVFAAAHQVLRLSHGPGDAGRGGAHRLGVDVREHSARAIVGAIEHVLEGV